VIGKVVGNYRVVQLQAEDGFGSLFLAQHNSGWQATLRGFKTDVFDVPFVDRWFQTAQAAQASAHPGILHVVEKFWSQRNGFIATAVVPGTSLAASIQRDKRFWPELVVKLGWQLAVALGSAHHAGVIHKVLRPEGIFVAADTAAPGGVRTVITEIGASAALGDGVPDWRSPATAALGIPSYLAPEVARGGGETRSDVYSLGCLLFHMAAGRPPYLGQGAQDVIAAHQQMMVRGPGSYEQSIPAELDNLVQRMIAKEIGARPLSMEDVAGELEAIAHHYWGASEQKTMSVSLPVGRPPPPVGRSRTWMIVAAGLVVLGGGGGVLAAFRPWEKKVVAATIPDAAPPPPAPDAAPPEKPASDLDVRLAEARKAMEEERWPDAAASARIAQKLDPKNEDAAKILKTARAEPANKVAYDEFHKAVEAGDVETASRRIKRIAGGSLYLTKASTELDRMREVFVKAKEAEARTLAEGKLCKRIDPIQKAVAKVFPESADRIKVIADGCGK